MIWSRRTLLKASLVRPAYAAGGRRSQMRTLEGSGRVWDIWRIPGHFTKNPDLIQVTLTDGVLQIADQPDALTQYILMPPKSFRCDIVLEARLRVEGPP